MFRIVSFLTLLTLAYNHQSPLGLNSAFASSDSIVIRAKKKKDTLKRGVNRLKIGLGQTRIQKPKNAAEFEAAESLLHIPAATSAKSGQAALSHFSLFKVRGHDPILTEIYFEDILLQDPYGGLPLAQGLELKAFGEMQVHVGLAPYDIPSLNAVTSIRFINRSVVKKRQRIGLLVDSLKGFGQWVQAESHSSAKNGDLSFRAYLSHFASPGRRKVFSNNGTPANQKDDKQIEIKNSESETWQAVTFLKKEMTSGQSLEAWARHFRSDSGFTLPFAANSSAKSSQRQSLIGLGLAKKAASGQFKLHFSVRRDESMLNDSLSTTLTFATRQALRTQNANSSLSWHSDALPLGNSNLGIKQFSKLEGSQTRVVQSLDSEKTTSKILQWKLYTGVQLKPQRNKNGIMASLKGMISDTEKKREPQGQKSSGTKNDAANEANSYQWGTSLGYQWQESFKASTWLQYADFKRLPSLVEEFGNGSTIRPSIALKQERTKHFEWGLQLTPLPKRLHLSATAFRDVVENKISFVSTSFLDSKAINLQPLTIDGLEGQAQFLAGPLSASLGGHTLQTSTSIGQSLPNTPLFGVKSDVGVAIGKVNFGWNAAFKGPSFRDATQDVQNESTSLHNLRSSFLWENVSTERNWLHIKDVEFAVQLKNVANAQAQKTKSVVNNYQGIEARSEVRGYALPGRHLVLMVEATL